MGKRQCLHTRIYKYELKSKQTLPSNSPRTLYLSKGKKIHVLAQHKSASYIKQIVDHAEKISSVSNEKL